MAMVAEHYAPKPTQQPLPQSHDRFRAQALPRVPLLKVGFPPPWSSRSLSLQASAAPEPEQPFGASAGGRLPGRGGSSTDCAEFRVLRANRQLAGA